jgi:hypothetical protein
MSNHSLLQSFNDFNKFINNTNTFLLDISLPIINYLLNKNDDFYELFNDTCLNNRRFASDSLQNDLSDETNDFLLCMAGAWGCDCCHDRNPIRAAEFHQEIVQRFHEHCLYLLSIVDQNKFHEKIARLPAFSDDYIAIKTNLMDGRIDRAQAESELLYWQGAIPDSLLQEAILQLRYDYISTLIGRSKL